MLKAPRILIVGAGPTGLMASLELARRGITADIIDRKSEPSHLSRAVGITPASMALLSASGVDKAIRAEAIPLQKLAVFHKNTPLAQFDIKLKNQPALAILGLPQNRTEHHLAEGFKAHGGHIEYGAELDNVTQTADAVTASIAGQSRTYDYVIGADGTRSRVRQCVGAEYKGFQLPDTWSIADVDVEHWPYQNTFIICDLPGPDICVAVQLEYSRVRIFSNSENALEDFPLDIDVKTVRRSGAFKIDIRQVDSYTHGRVFLAGDAAHCHSPVGGRGMNLGIADAADLARRFAEGGLDGYSDARHGEGQRIINLSEQGRKLIQSSHPFTRAALWGLIKIVQRVPALQQRITKTLLLA